MLCCNTGNSLRRLQNEKVKNFYKKELKNTENQIEALSSDPQKLERFARETFWMHKPGEQVILVEPLKDKE